MIKIICDRCGTEIAPKKIGYVALGFRETPSGELVTGNQFEGFHFCSECIEKINAFISFKETSSSKETGDKPAEYPTKGAPLIDLPQTDEQPTKPRRKIDIGKILALRDAGWTYLEIADEMGMSSAAVSQAVYAYRRKHERNEEA